MQNQNNDSSMSSEAAPTADPAWDGFRGQFLDFSHYVMIDARLMLDKTHRHPLAGVVGRIVREGGCVAKIEIPYELAAAADAIEIQGASLGIRSLLPLSAYMVERNSRTTEVTWRLTAAGVALLRTLNVEITDASLGVFDADT